MPSSIAQRPSAGSPAPTRGHLFWGLRRLVACGGLLACSLLAPSDAELLGSGDGVSGAGGMSASAMVDGGAGRASAAGGAGGSLPEGVVYPVLPLGGSNGGPQPDASEPPPSAPDAGPSESPPCIDCESTRITGGVETRRLGTREGSQYMDICPHDQVVVGMDYKFDFGTPEDFGYFTSVALVCGELVPNRRAGSLDVVIGESLAPRGGGSGASGTGGRCPLGQVVTAFEGARNFDGTTSEIRELTLHCAPLVLAPDRAVAIGSARPAQPMSADFASSTLPADEVMPLESCPEGQVVRGAVVRAGAWVDGISFVCGTPVLALPEGQACGSAIECQSGRCDGACQPRPCSAPAGCTCRLLENAQYAFCGAAETQSTAVALCAASGMHLAYAQDPIAHGWLRSSAVEAGIQAAFWLGADDLVSEGSWQWIQGGGAVDLGSELWDENEQRGSAAENCMEMTRDAHWDDVPCTLTLPFVCEAPEP